MMIKTRECNLEDIKPFYQQAKKEGIITTTPKKPVIFVCAEVNGEIVGFARIIHLSEKRARLGNFFVLPALRRQGIGSALVKYCLDLLGETVEQIDLYAYHPAVFKKFGFATSRQYESSYGSTCHMVKKKPF